MHQFSLPSVTCSAGVAGAARECDPHITAEDYVRAEKFTADGVSGLVTSGGLVNFSGRGGISVDANWLSDDRFWYLDAAGKVVLVDPVAKTTATCDSAQCATLGISAGTRPNVPTAVPTQGPPLTLSPNGLMGAFVKDFNLWVRDIGTGLDRQLTFDGEQDFAYATDNAGWKKTDRAVLTWSPDSKKIATQQQDERQVGEWHLVKMTGGHPELLSWKYPLPTDSIVAMCHRVVIDVETATVVRLDMPPDYHRATLGDDISMSDYKWSPDGSQLVLVSTPRDHKAAVVRLADTATGAVRTVMEEHVETHFESVSGFEVLWASSELLWYSQRDDWGNLYLYDLEAGTLKHQVTPSGEGPVTEIVYVDETARMLYYMANGRADGQDPYFGHCYRVGLDSGSEIALTPDDGTHSVSLSPNGMYLVDTCSSAIAPPVVSLRDASNGCEKQLHFIVNLLGLARELLLTLDAADISALLERGWKPPVPIVVKADDGQTDLYGMMFTPTHLDESKIAGYPIINNAYPGPQTGSVGSRAWSAARGDRQALAELGFVVVSIDGRGTPGRSKSFHDAYYGRMGRDNTIPDQVAGMKDLAKQYPYIDIDRAAMWGHSGGGFITADALFRFPEFFKVGISESGNHDQRLYEDDWGERYQGLLERKPDGTDNYDLEANQSLAGNLQGKLLLAHGTLDSNVPPENTMVVVDALIKANRDFDLLMIPNAGHGFGDASNYMMRRRWDYFVQHLLGATPPPNYQIGASAKL